MYSPEEICNLALSYLRAPSIQSINEKSIEGLQCKLHYDICRKTVLDELEWTFTRRRKALVQLSSEQVVDYRYVYAMPANVHAINCITVKLPEEVLNGNYNGVYTDLPVEKLKPYVAEYIITTTGTDRVIASNQRDLIIDYNEDVTDYSLYPAKFIMALSHLLASKLAVAVVGYDDGRSMVNENINAYVMYLEAAKADDVNLQGAQERESEFVLERF